MYSKSIRGTSYIMWMGEKNVAMVNDIRRCITGSGDSVYMSQYPFCINDVSIMCNYAVIKVPEKFRYEQNITAYVVIQVFNHNENSKGNEVKEDAA